MNISDPKKINDNPRTESPEIADNHVLIPAWLSSFLTKFTVSHREHWHEGKLHRIDGPAVESSFDGLYRHEYWQQGEMHRLDGPAFEIIKKDGDSHQCVTQEWLVNQKRHREDGPAIHCLGKIQPPEPWPQDSQWDQTPLPWKLFPAIPDDSLTELFNRCWAGYQFSFLGDFGTKMELLTSELDNFEVKWCLRPNRHIKEWEFDAILKNPEEIRHEKVKNLLDHLGSYTPETKLIELYFPTLLHCSRFLDERLPARADPCVMTLAVMVFVHEMGHAIDHAKAVRNNTAFPTTPAQDEASAQWFTWNVIKKHAPRARMLFEELEKHQPEIYKIFNKPLKNTF